MNKDKLIWKKNLGLGYSPEINKTLYVKYIYALGYALLCGAFGFLIATL